MNRDSESMGACLDRNSAAGTPEPAQTALETVRSAWRAVVRWMDRQRQRKHLRQLDDHLLRDIGVTRIQARREASRWFFE